LGDRILSPGDEVYRWVVNIRTVVEILLLLGVGGLACGLLAGAVVERTGVAFGFALAIGVACGLLCSLSVDVVIASDVRPGESSTAGLGVVVLPFVVLFSVVTNVVAAFGGSLFAWWVFSPPEDIGRID
jgi:hypothetical protein